MVEGRRRQSRALCVWVGVWACLWSVFVGSGVSHAEPVRVIDDRGQTVELNAPARRIVSVLPSLTETVCALGACERLVGVDRYSSWPASVSGLPRVGGGLDPAIESIVALRPDLVLVATSSRGVERLEQLGLKVVALEPRTHADVRRTLGVVAVLVGQPATVAQDLWDQMDAALTDLATSLPERARRARVYVEVNSAPYAASESSFIGETLSRLGVGNVVPAALGPFPKLNPEFVVRANPSLILVGERDRGGLAGRPGWSGMQAVRNGQVCALPPDAADLMVRPGPRLAEGARVIVECLLRGTVAGDRP